MKKFSLKDFELIKKQALMECSPHQDFRIEDLETRLKNNEGIFALFNGFMDRIRWEAGEFDYTDKDIKRCIKKFWTEAEKHLVK